MRTRTKLNDKKEIIEAYYSKLYGSINFTHCGFSIRGYSNKNLNDTNLECIDEPLRK